MRKNFALFVITLLSVATLCIAETAAASKSMSKNQGGNSFDQIIISKSKETWEAYKSKNIAAIKALTAEDYVSYTQAGPSNLQQDIATIDKLTIDLKHRMIRRFQRLRRMWQFFDTNVTSKDR